MLIADTSIWIDHFRKDNSRLSGLLARREVLIHPFVIGELALGHLPRFRDIVGDLEDLPAAQVATAEEVLLLIVDRKLSGSGIGYVDAHLVASALLVPGTRLWTRDKRLDAVAQSLSLAVL